jgi:hypothetical protein
MRKRKKQFVFKLKPSLYVKILVPIVVVVIILGLVGYFTIYRPYVRLQAKGAEVMQSASNLKEVFSKNDIELVKKEIQTVKKDYKEFQQEAQSIYWASFIPQVNDFKSGVAAGERMISAAEKSVVAIEPYADLIGFKKGEASFVEKSSEDRLQTAVLTLDKLLTNIDSISQDIEEAEKLMDEIDPKDYPEKIGDTYVRGRIEEVKTQFDAASSLFVDAKPFLKKLPEILGKDEEKTYLILFQNEYERRATGGFLTAYATFKIKEGKIELNDSRNIYDLDETISERPDTPEKILQYHKDVSTFNIRDSNLSPDFPESIKLFESLYENSSSKIEYDGIITMDAKVLVDMLEIFGETEAAGMKFSAEIDERCDCPQVIYAIFDNVGRIRGYQVADRKGILGDLMYALFYKAIGFSPSKYWGPLAQTMFQNLDEKHIMVYFTDEEIQKAADNLNWTGRIREFDSDYLHINNVNFAGAKSNLFIDETVTSETMFEDGKVKRKVHISFKNPYPHSDCSLERETLCLNATLRNWIRFYVPEGSELTSFEGSQTETLTYKDMGKTVFEGFMTVSPQGKAEVTIEYVLPDRITKDNYQLYIQKQGMIDQQELEVIVDNEKVYDDKFKMDELFEI